MDYETSVDSDKNDFTKLTTKVIDPSLDVFAGTSESCSAPRSLLGSQIQMFLILYSIDSEVANEGMY